MGCEGICHLFGVVRELLGLKSIDLRDVCLANTASVFGALYGRHCLRCCWGTVRGIDRNVVVHELTERCCLQLHPALYVEMFW